MNGMMDWGILVPRCLQAHKLGHSKECLTAQGNFIAQ